MLNSLRSGEWLEVSGERTVLYKCLILYKINRIGFLNDTEPLKLLNTC